MTTGIGADPLGIVYFYAPGRGAGYAATIFDGFTDILLDGYAAYKTVAKAAPHDTPLRLAHCWAHGRRQLREIFDKDGSAIAEEGLRQIARLYRIEAEIWARSATERLAVRQVRSRPLVEAFGTWLAEQRARISAKSRLAEMLASFANHWEGLQVFLDDGRVDIDTNAVENAIRPLTLNRKNALFAVHKEGGASWTRIASLIETAKLNGFEPFDYLKATLKALPNGRPQSRLDDLLPWAFKPASS